MKLWIARQQDNSVYLFTQKPVLISGRWCVKGVNQCYTKFRKKKVCVVIFPEVTFENSPQEVELKLVEK